MQNPKQKLNAVCLKLRLWLLGKQYKAYIIKAAKTVLEDLGEI